jgi:hypothetical protein
MGIKSLTSKLDRYWKFTLAINFFLGVSLWFGMLTDFEFRIPIINLLFPFFVLGTGLITTTKLEIPRKALTNFLCLPSIAGGLPYIFFAIMVIVNPFAWLLANRITNVEFVNSYTSSDGIRTAEVYILPGSNYEMKTYNVEIKLRYKFLPLIVRHIYGGDNDFIFRKDEVENYKIRWINNDQLNISYDGETVLDRDKLVLVNKMKFVIPIPLELLFSMFHLR